MKSLPPYGLPKIHTACLASGGERTVIYSSCSELMLEKAALGKDIGVSSFNISPSNEQSGLISFRMDWLDLLAVQGTLKSLLQHHSSKASIQLILKTYEVFSSENISFGAFFYFKQQNA